MWLIRDGIRDRDGARSRWAWLALLGLMYFALHQQLDFYMNFPGFLFAAALPVAYLDATTMRSPPWGAPTALSRIVLVPAAATIIASLVFLLWQEGPALRMSAAMRFADQGDWTAAAQPAGEAHRRDSTLPPYALTNGLAAAFGGNHETAIGLFQSVALSDDLPEAWLDLASELHAAGRDAEAADSIARALRLGSQDPTVAMAAGDLALRVGEPTLATTAFASAVSAQPSLAADTWWDDEANRRSAFESALQELRRKGSAQVVFTIALLLRDYDSATRTSAEHGLQAEDLIAAWQGDDTAATRVFDECEASPTDVNALQWCVLLAVDHRNGQLASRYVDLASRSSAIVGLMRVTETGQAGVVGGSYRWGTFTYRRTTPADLLGPDLIRLRLVTGEPW
jgi:tetratricopeptide (TPR) repeat protein